MITPKLPSYIENLPYTEDQWSATNTSGNRVYSRAFMLQLSSEIVCQRKLDILKSWSHITRSVNPSQYNSIELGGGMPVVVSQSASATGFMPAYGAYLKSGDRQCGMPVMPCAKNNCSHGKTANKTAKPNTIHMSLSLREEVKLNQTENAWVPTAIKKTTKIDASKNKNEVDLITEDVNKNVRSILNKITPENKDSLTEMFKELSIDSYERLEKTVDLIFEKAIEEQNFARLCHAMQGVQVNTDGKTTSFKKRIISKCQSLFELDKAQEMDSAKKLAEINSCKDPDKKKELQTEFKENEGRLRKRSVGNCRFIGELFKQKMLTPNIMLYCINNLVTKHNEEPLECICNLLKTVGKELEQTYNLNETFDKLKGLTSKQFKSKISSRIQFMIQDVIDLREDKWITRHLENKPKLINEEFVKNMLISSLEISPKCQTETGKMFAELLSKNVLSIVALTEGIDAVLKDWNDYLMDYPQFFSYIAAITAPLLISKTASFDFFNLRDACKSICPDNSSKYFIEILQKILSSKETQDIKEQGGILWIYNKWRKSEKISIDVFVPNNKLNEHFKEDRVGVFLLSIAMYDKMKLTDSKLLYDIMHQWITDNIDGKIIECPQFVRALTIANVLVCLKPNYSFDDFFDKVYVKLLTCYIQSKPLPSPEIQAREVQCLYGIQIMSAALEHPAGMVLKLFHKLYQDSVISKESFELWKNDDVFKPGFDEDLETKTWHLWC